MGEEHAFGIVRFCGGVFDGGRLGCEDGLVSVEVAGPGSELWTLTTGPSSFAFAPPTFAIDGRAVTAALSSPKWESEPRQLTNGVTEHHFSGQFANDPALLLEMIIRIPPDNPVLRFRYILHSVPEAKMTGDGAQLRYLDTSFAALPHCRQVQLSGFNDMLHSYTVAELEVPERSFADGLALTGATLTGADSENRTLLVAYEHGAQIPDAFLQFKLDSTRRVSLQATKANYLPGQKVDGYSTVWMQAAAGHGCVDELAGQYRRFVLEYMSLHRESRRSYIFYTTWNFQERNKWQGGKAYLDSMNPERILAEIDMAHRMEIEVFVLDTGWYEKTGDWEVSRGAISRCAWEVKARLRRYGMKLGLWFDPRAAAKSSGMLARYRNCVRAVKGSGRKAAADLGDRSELSDVLGEPVQ